jgi:hypothetical protein
MITIDLLKGQGKPTKADPKAALLVVGLFAVPLSIAIFLVASYLNHGAMLAASNVQLVNVENGVADLSVEIQDNATIEQSIHHSNSCLDEIAEVLPRYNQWSTLLQALARHIPASFIVSEVEVIRSHITKEVPNRDNPELKLRVTVPKRVLRITILDYLETENEQAVQTFIQKLKEVTATSKQVEDLRLVAHKKVEIDEEMVTQYEIECPLHTDS